jgi:hypothetical protein
MGYLVCYVYPSSLASVALFEGKFFHLSPIQRDFAIADPQLFFAWTGFIDFFTSQALGGISKKSSATLKAHITALEATLKRGVTIHYLF